MMTRARSRAVAAYDGVAIMDVPVKELAVYIESRLPRFVSPFPSLVPERVAGGLRVGKWVAVAQLKNADDEQLIELLYQHCRIVHSVFDLLDTEIKQSVADAEQKDRVSRKCSAWSYVYDSFYLDAIAILKKEGRESV